MRRKFAGLIAGTAVLVCVLAACTSHGHRSAAGLEGGAGGSTAGGGSAATEPAVGAANASSVKGGDAFDAAAVATPGPSVIRTADITVVTGSVGARADQARRIATDAGGTLDGDDRTAGEHPSATLVLRIPPARLDDVLTQLSALGKEQTRHSSSRDVTTQVADVDSRVRSAVAAIAQLQGLYSKATRVADVIAIEGELSQREADLESLQAQQRALAGQVSLATLTLYLVPAPVTAKHHATHRGFSGGLSHGWNAFTHTLAVLVTGLGAALPFLIIAAAIGGLWVLVRRRRPASNPAPLVPAGAS